MQTLNPRLGPFWYWFVHETGYICRMRITRQFMNNCQDSLHPLPSSIVLDSQTTFFTLPYSLRLKLRSRNFGKPKPSLSYVQYALVYIKALYLTSFEALSRAMFYKPTFSGLYPIGEVTGAAPTTTSRPTRRGPRTCRMSASSSASTTRLGPLCSDQVGPWLLPFI